ncbi:hypothetical protein [Rhizobacter fulvus]|jgi:hypothetical protein
MQVVRDYESLASVPDLHLHALLEKCVASLTSGFDDYDLAELVTFIVIEPGDLLEAIDTALGFPILTRPFELLADHPDWYELVFVVSDDGYGIEVFISKASGVDPRLLSMCSAHLETTR